ncbi:MAG: hypothetical protein V4568_16735 [Pseudomonadota bacterium]
MPRNENNGDESTPLLEDSKAQMQDLKAENKALKAEKAEKDAQLAQQDQEKEKQHAEQAKEQKKQDLKAQKKKKYHKRYDTFAGGAKWLVVDIGLLLPFKIIGAILKAITSLFKMFRKKKDKSIDEEKGTGINVTPEKKESLIKVSTNSKSQDLAQAQQPNISVSMGGAASNILPLPVSPPPVELHKGNVFEQFAALKNHKDFKESLTPIKDGSVQVIGIKPLTDEPGFSTMLVAPAININGQVRPERIQEFKIPDSEVDRYKSKVSATNDPTKKITLQGGKLPHEATQDQDINHDNTQSLNQSGEKQNQPKGKKR